MMSGPKPRPDPSEKGRIRGKTLLEASHDCVMCPRQAQHAAEAASWSSQAQRPGSTVGSCDERPESVITPLWPDGHVIGHVINRINREGLGLGS